LKNKETDIISPQLALWLQIENKQPPQVILGKKKAFRLKQG
jgi:hypothetical protein